MYPCILANFKPNFDNLIIMLHPDFSKQINTREIQPSIEMALPYTFSISELFMTLRSSQTKSSTERALIYKLSISELY